MQEQTYILAAIESLRNELLARDDARKESIDGIVSHLEKLNGRTRKTETAITRLNLIVFGVGGPVSLAVLGVVLKLWLKI